MGEYTRERLKELQALPLERKVGFTCARITEWYNHYKGQVYVSFSGGKDSTVLLHIARSLYPDIKAMFVDTGLEYPEIKQFVKTFKNIDIIRPKISFKEVLQKYGYPVVSMDVSNKVICVRNVIEKLKKKFPATNNLKDLLSMAATTIHSNNSPNNPTIYQRFLTKQGWRGGGGGIITTNICTFLMHHLKYQTSVVAL